MGVSLETCLRRREDVLIGRGCCVFLRRHRNVPIRRCIDVPLPTFHQDIVGCFIWDVPATLLGRIERRRYDAATTSYCRLGKYDGHKRGLVSMIYKFLIKSPQVVMLIHMQINLLLIMSILLGLAEELHKPIIRKFLRRTVYSRQYWGAD